jgi:hypothetical protein
MAKTFLSNADINFLLGNGPKVVSKAPMVRKQGNGNFTGFVRSTYSDGSTSDFEFVVNAKTKADVLAAYEPAA